MFDYTKTAIDLIIQVFKKVIFWVSLCSQIFSIVYLIYALCVSAGNPIINALLLTIAVGSFGYFVYTYTKENREKNGDTVKHIFSFSKIIIKFFNLAIIIYGFYTASTVAPITIIVTVLAIICWILQVLFEILAILVGYIKAFLLDAIQADLEGFKKPFTSTGNFFKRLVGIEVEKPQQTKTQQMLSQRIQKKKEARKQAKVEEKEQKKAKKKTNKAARKAGKSNPTPSVSTEIAVSKDDK